MKVLRRFLGPLLLSLGLASCGGGGGGGNSAFEPPSSGTLTVTATATQLPVNNLGILPFPGSPYMSEVTVTWRKANGDLMIGQKVSVAIAPVQVAAFSTLDDPTTADKNEFQILLGSGPVDATNGVATIFLTSGNVAGTATLTITAQDPATTTNITKTVTFNVVNATPPLPASVVMVTSPVSVYLQGSGGTTSSQISALVRDGGGQNIVNPGTSTQPVNNIQFEVLGPAGSGTLSAVSAGGAAQSGTVVKTRTISGIAAAGYNSGTIEGPVQIRTTVDKADNNIDNGISDPLTSVASVVVSDGKLYSLVITSPVTNAILVNRVTGSAAPAAGETIPISPDGTYSLTVSALATDRQGNPVVPGTAIRFGSIDEPLIGFPDQGSGTFTIAGLDGNPQEGGTLFTAPTGHFTTASGGAGPGDTLLVFGDLVSGNRDLENVRILQNVNSATSLNVTVPFNRNDDTGSSVDYGSVLPYVIGRATEGNIGASAVTNEAGVASVTLNYPVSRLGKSVYVYAQGDGPNVNGYVKKVADIAGYVFPGVAPLKLTASPETIPGNTTFPVTVCAVDALGSPILGAFPSFAFHDLGVGNGKVDGIAGAGTLDHATSYDGCVVAQVATNGIATSASQAGVRFTLGGAGADVKISPNGGLALIANPSGFYGGGGTVTLTLLDSSGQPVPGVLITGTCTASGGATVAITSGPGTTNAAGKTTADISTANTNQVNGSGGGTCTFTTASGSPTATVTITGYDICKASLGTSPAPAGCATTNVVLTVTMTSAGGYGGSVTSSPSGLSCTIPPAGSAQTCTGTFSSGTGVTVNAAINVGANPAGSGHVTFSGACSVQTPTSATVSMSQAQTCNVAFGP